jgi:hypothetical protein
MFSRDSHPNQRGCVNSSDVLSINAIDCISLHLFEIQKQLARLGHQRTELDRTIEVLEKLMDTGARAASAVCPWNREEDGCGAEKKSRLELLRHIAASLDHDDQDYDDQREWAEQQSPDKPCPEISVRMAGHSARSNRATD